MFLDHPGAPDCSTTATVTLLPIDGGGCVDTTYTFTGTDSYNYPDIQPNPRGCGTAQCTPVPLLPPFATGGLCTSANAAGGGCATACAAPPGAGRLCILPTGNVASPAGYKAQPPASLTTGTNDLRRCSPVACGGSSLTCQQVADVDFFSDALCANALASFSGMACVTATAETAVAYEVLFTVTGSATCTLDAGSLLTDTSAFTSPQTLCCL
jgi:hypothetical protein